jgi:predicted nucleic acid-binding protein
VYFVESSALVKAYATEAGSPAVDALLDGSPGSIYVSSVVILETAAALTRMRRTQRMREKTYTRARDRFLGHCRTRFHVVHPPASLITAAVGMIDSYRMRSAGGFDLLHIATAEYIRALLPGGSISLVCCDEGLRSIAEERGLDVFDPLRDPLPEALRPPGEGDG